MSGDPTKAASPAPRVRDLVVLLPLLVIDLVLLAWLKRHFHFILAWASASVGAAVVLAAWRFLPDDTVKGARLGFARLLTSRRLAGALWIAFGALAAVTLFVASVHVTAEEPTPGVMLYAVAEPTGSPERAHIIDSVRLDRLRTHRDFHFLVPPTGRRMWIQTSTLRRTRPMMLGLWAAPSLGYPDEFDPLVVVTMLPMGDFVTAVGPDLRLVVTTDALSSPTLATATLDTMQSLTLSFVEPPPPDTATRRRWLGLVTGALRLDDTTDAAPLVKDWMRSRWVKTTRVLNVGERLRFAVLSTGGDTLAADTVTLSRPVSDVIIHRRP